jgi:hypothetical protein
MCLWDTEGSGVGERASHRLFDRGGPRATSRSTIPHIVRIRGRLTLTVEGQADQVKELDGLSEILLIDRGVVIVDEASKHGTPGAGAVRIGALKGRLIPWARVIQISFESDEALFTEF